MLSFAIALERLEIIAGWHSQIAQPPRNVKGTKLPARDREDLSRKTFGTQAIEYGLRHSVPEAPDHVRATHTEQ